MIIVCLVPHVYTCLVYNIEDVCLFNDTVDPHLTLF